jgi:hypothetical protein
MRLHILLLLLSVLLGSTRHNGEDQPKAHYATQQAGTTANPQQNIPASLPTTGPAKTHPETTEQENKTANTPKPMSNAERVMAVLTAIYVLLTGFYVWFAGRTIRHATETSERQLRAYICVSKGRLNYREDGYEPQIHFANRGQTPAYDVKIWAESAVREYPSWGPLQLRRPPEDAPMANGILGPDGKYKMVTRKVPTSVANQTFMQTRYQILYVYGEATYKDAFGVSRYTRFRLIFGGPAGTRSRIDKEGNEMGYLSEAPEGNEAN